MSEKLRICRKCLLMEEPGEEFFQRLDLLVKNLEEGVRVSQEVYDERLKICGTCENLIEGTCKLCGCYVVLRAALRKKKCPAVPAKWR